MSERTPEERLLTVVDVCRSLHLEPEDHLMWMAGERARDKWQALGNPMNRALRTKKNGGGTHMFAVYPGWFRPELERIIKALCTEKDRQGDLFG
jgi:hypothetical protein